MLLDIPRTFGTAPGVRAVCLYLDSSDLTLVAFRCRQCYRQGARSHGEVAIIAASVFVTERELFLKSSINDVNKQWTVPLVEALLDELFILARAMNLDESVLPAKLKQTTLDVRSLRQRHPTVARLHCLSMTLR